MTGALEDSAVATDPPRVESAFIQVTINNQELLAFLGSGCEVDVVSETAGRRYNVPVHSEPITTIPIC